LKRRKFLKLIFFENYLLKRGEITVKKAQKIFVILSVSEELSLERSEKSYTIDRSQSDMSASISRVGDSSLALRMTKKKGFLHL